MDTFLKVTLVVTALYLLVLGSVTKTKNTLSATIFNTIPLLTGIACVIAALYVFGVIK